MRFDERFPEVMLAFRPQFFVPAAPVVVDVDEGQIQQTGRRYPCLVCNKRTGWRAVIDECPDAPICSEECRQTFLTDGTETVVDLASEIQLETNNV